MPQPIKVLSPEELVRDDMRRKYRADYQKIARGGKSITWGEVGMLALFGASMFTAMGLSLIPTMPLAALILPGVVAVVAMAKATSPNSGIEKKARALLEADIDNGKLLPRYRKDLFEGPEVAGLRAKFAGIRRLSAVFASNAAPAATVSAAEAVPAVKIAAPGPKA